MIRKISGLLCLLACSYVQAEISECGNAFIVNRTNLAADIKLQGHSETVPVGVYVDINRQLMWIACPLGQTQDSETTCLLTAADQYSWQSALQTIQQFNQDIVPFDQSGFIHQDWRLPNVKELLSLYRHPSCRLPKVDAFKFTLPDIDGGNQLVWTATPDIDNNANSWMVDLETGITQSVNKTEQGRVWLVRDIKPQ